MAEFSHELILINIVYAHPEIARMYLLKNLEVLCLEFYQCCLGIEQFNPNSINAIAE